MFNILFKHCIITESNAPIHTFQTLSQTTNFIDSSKLKDFADNHFKFDENDRKFSKQVEKKTLWEKEKLLVKRHFSIPHGVFKTLVQQTSKYQDLFGKGLTVFCLIFFPSHWLLSDKTVTETII